MQIWGWGDGDWGGFGGGMVRVRVGRRRKERRGRNMVFLGVVSGVVGCKGETEGKEGNWNVCEGRSGYLSCLCGGIWEYGARSGRHEVCWLDVIWFEMGEVGK